MLSYTIPNLLKFCGWPKLTKKFTPLLKGGCERGGEIEKLGLPEGIVNGIFLNHVRFITVV